MQVEADQLDTVMTSQTLYMFEERLTQKLKCLDMYPQVQYNSLAATSTSLSQVSDDSQECVSEMGDIQAE